MLRIRYDTDPDFCAIFHLVGSLDEELAAIDQLLSDEKLLKLIEADLSQRYPHTTQTRTRATVFFLNLTRILLLSWGLSKLFYQNLLINQSSDSNMKNNDISDKGVTGTMVCKGVLAISKEALGSTAVCIGEIWVLNVGLPWGLLPTI